MTRRTSDRRVASSALISVFLVACLVHEDTAAWVRPSPAGPCKSSNSLRQGHFATNHVTGVGERTVVELTAPGYDVGKVCTRGGFTGPGADEAVGLGGQGTVREDDTQHRCFQWGRETAQPTAGMGEYKAASLGDEVSL